MGSAKAESLSRPMVQIFPDGGQFLFADQSQIPVLGEKLADEPVGIFVDSPFPERIGMRKIDRGVKILRHPRMITKFPAIVIRDGVDGCLVWPKAAAHGRSDCSGRLVRKALEHRILRAAFH